MGLQYTGLPATAKANGITTSIGDKTYFGTDESIPIRPVLTCNPNNNLATHQVLNGACFSAPAVGTQGGKAWPYMSQTAYFNNALAVYRTFHIYEKQQVQFRVSAFDWLNHSLLTFNGGTPTTVNYNVDYASKTITPNFNQTNTGTNAFGVMTIRSALPYARVMELDREVLVLIATLQSQREGAQQPLSRFFFAAKIAGKRFVAIVVMRATFAGLDARHLRAHLQWPAMTK